MNKTQRVISLLALSAAAFGLVACDQSQPPTVGQKIDAGIQRTEEAASQVKKDAQAAGNDIKQEASQAGAAIADGAADVAITAKVKTALAGDDQLSAMAISVDTVGSVVTLTGPAPTQVASDRASALAKAVEGVKDVKNQLVVSANS